ncbi:MAG: hypothetical protein GTO22_22010, partial [Gemmatimonadales bacterium]|nr:hypothetical protein [Gemmatimonadales bacterium]
AAGCEHSLGLKSDGSIVAWGWNDYGQCDVPSPNTGFVAVAGGGFHSLGLKADTWLLGSVRVTIIPQAAVDAGAEWRRLGAATWRNSGETETGIPVGVEAVEFKDVAGWVKPANRLVNISALQTTDTSGTYGEVVAVGVAKLLSDGTLVGIDAAVVSAAWPDVFYIEADDRSCGIRVEKAGHALTEGMRADVVGALATDADAERYINADTAVPAGTGSVAPVGLTNKCVGGGDWNYDPVTGIGQKGVRDSAALNNIGLLIRTWGRVTYKDTDHFYLDDGSKLDDGSGHLGVKVLATGLSIPAQDAYVQVTG